MHDISRHVLPRLDRFLTERLEPALYSDALTISVTSWEAPGEPVSFAEAMTQEFVDFEVGSSWGRPWGTTWFRVIGTVPQYWTLSESNRVELVVDLGFIPGIPGFQAEALVWTPEGVVVSAIEPLNRSVLLSAVPGEQIELYLEAASNPDIAQGFSFRETQDGDPSTAGTEPIYMLRQMAIALLDTVAWELLQDLRSLRGLVRELTEDLPRHAAILVAIDRCLDAIDLDDIHGTAAEARVRLAGVLATPAYATAHRIHAVGHAHIDSAWLWPLRETRRKVARTFSNVLRLLEQHPEFIFAASSAQQFAWVKEDYPELFERIRQAVAAGRFVPVGGQWVEPDSNLPSGESLSRQFLEGKKFFREEFDVEPREVWVPDSFGYSGALPQIALAAGANYFLTQKISWNDTNPFPHHTFLWEGIDGSRILTHFPPADTYNSMVSAGELHGAQRRFRDKDGSNASLLPFGWGDGGGGPTREMLASATRFGDLEGSPRVILSSPQRFFQEISAEYENPPVWVGELYLESHRGVATTQIELKRGNREAESLLRQAEHWSTHAAVTVDYPYPQAELQRLWREVLLLQFHDILPGTSIHWVHREAAERYLDVHAELKTLIDRAAHALLGWGEFTTHLNAGPYAIGNVAAFAVEPAESVGFARGFAHEHGVTLENPLVRLQIDAKGHINSLYDKAHEREVIASDALAGLLQLHPDTPTEWDAWNLDQGYRRSVTDLTDVEYVRIVDDAEGTAVRVRRRFGASAIDIEYRLSAHEPTLQIAVELDWHENEKILKLAFPLALHVDRAASEIQYGHLYRAIHTNTSWDAARYETVAHRWLQLGEPDYGVALANEATYGYDITRDVRDGENIATLRISLARAPRYPDPTSDRGRHRYSFALRVGAGIGDAVREGYRLNVPLRSVDGVARTELMPLVRVDHAAVVVEAVKLAEDGSGDVIIRLYEAHGRRVSAMLVTGFEHIGVIETDLLERASVPKALRCPEPTESGAIRMQLTPFQLVTLRFSRQIAPQAKMAP